MWRTSADRRDRGGNNTQQDKRERKEKETFHFRRTDFIKVRQRGE